MLKKQICIIMCIILTCLACSCGTNKAAQSAEVYYINENQDGVVSESYKINFSDKAEAIQKVIEKMMESPSKPGRKSVFPKNVKINNISIKETIAYIDFSKEIYNLDNIGTVFLNAALTDSVTLISGIGGILITVDGKDYVDSEGIKIGILYPSDIVFDVYDETTVTKYAKLYFASQDAEGLVAESRAITVSDKETAELKIVQELLKGPENSELVKTIPADTKILSVETKEGTCFVNLSKEFITKHPGGTAAEALTVYSIVNSLTELDTVNQVQFLIEGQKSESYIHMIFNEPFSRNESYIIKQN